MTYQPPLIGSKQLLNISAVSLPSVAAIIIFISMFLNVAALHIDSKRKKHEN
jgi:copper chaperone NosL